MTRTSRRAILGALAAGLVGGAAASGAGAGTFSALTKQFGLGGPTPILIPRSPSMNARVSRDPGRIRAENQRPGSSNWQMVSDDAQKSDGDSMPIAGYTSTTSVNIGEAIQFYVRTNRKSSYTISIYRLGYYGGTGARYVTKSPLLRGTPQPNPKMDESTGLVSCEWEAVWRLAVPENWTSGAYLAAFTTDSGSRSYAPFVVRDDQRAAALCVILPFPTYQAYNRWPLDDHKLGKSLYLGYQGEKASYVQRAFKVSFDRPYDRNGLPSRFDRDHYFIQWVEQVGYDVTYASSIDLHAGRVDPAQYAGLVFCGHDEYWSTSMRNIATSAIAQGTSLCFMTANNMYWHIRFEQSSIGRDNRVIVCYKSDPDPGAERLNATGRWRDIRRPEQALLGVQYNGIVGTTAHLVVQAADHWFWAGCNVKNGSNLRNMVLGEADGLDQQAPRVKGVEQTLLSASPYSTRDGGCCVQNTSVYETENGGLVFVAATLGWPLGLSQPALMNPRIQQATTNLFNRVSERV